MAWADVVSGGLTPQAAVEKAFKRVEEIFAKYPIVQSQYVQVFVERGHAAFGKATVALNQLCSAASGVSEVCADTGRS
jgi:hypothetical protein